MKKSNLGMLAVSAAFVVLASPAHALPVTVGGSIANNTLLTAGARAGSFDLSAVLQPNSQIGSASYSFSFADNSDALTFGASVQSGVVTTPFVWINSTSGGYYVYDMYSRNRTTSFTAIDSRPGEGAIVTLGSASVAAGSGATAMTTSTQSYGPTRLGTTYYTVDYGDIWIRESCSKAFAHGCGYWTSAGNATYATVDYEIVNATLNDPTGTFTVSGSITDAGLLAEMITNQSLSFSLDIWGNLLLSSASLTLDINANNANDAVSAVPEPGTFALAGAGLAMALAVSRRRRQQGAGR